MCQRRWNVLLEVLLLLLPPPLLTLSLLFLLEVLLEVLMHTASCKQVAGTQCLSASLPMLCGTHHHCWCQLTHYHHRCQTNLRQTKLREHY